PTDRVVYHGQEVAAVIADSRYAAADGVLEVKVDYESLEAVVDPIKALEPDSPLVRTDREEQTNLIWNWEAGDQEATAKIFNEAEVVVSEDLYIPRIHVSSIETCGCVASYDKTSEKLTLWLTSQAPHAHRTVFSL